MACLVKAQTQEIDVIVQSAPEGAPHFVLKMAEHTAFAVQLAEAFGNAEFEPVAPREEMLFVIANHDRGWAPFDDAPGLDPRTGLPWNLIETPRDIVLATGRASPDFNEAHHLYCGLISSMHIWGLYNGRYGFSDRVLVDSLPDEDRPKFEAMLDGQLERQARIKETLAENPKTAPWIEESRLFQNYKQLQLFDTMSLYFQIHGPDDRKPSAFTHVPKSATDDVTVHIEPVDAETYRLDPFPFREDNIRLGYEGRYLKTVVGGDSELNAAMATTPIERQYVRFVAA